MANGRMGAIKPSATTNTALYSAPASTIATVTVSVCNQGASTDNIRIAVCSGAIGTLADTDYIEYESSVPAGSVLERTGIVIYNGQSIIVRSTTGTTSFVAYGLEG